MLIRSAGGGLGTSIAVGMIPEFVHFQKFEIIVIVWLAFSAVADCAITIALVWHLVNYGLFPCAVLILTECSSAEAQDRLRCYR